MPTLNVIYSEIKAIPINRLDELYQVIRSLTPAIKQQDKDAEARQKKILSYAGTFSDMTVENYSDFTNELRSMRKTLFNRTVDL
jgi:DNA-directed RNA polymerase subunit F